MRLRRFFPKLAASMSVSLVLLGVGAAQTPVAHEFNPPTVPAFTSLVSFNQTNGAYPGGSTLVQGTDGNFYGTTSEGGANNYGTVFKVTPAGVLTTIYSFCSQSNCADGSYPSGGLIQATDGNFYGVTDRGGINGDGTVYKITSAGLLTTVHSFHTVVDGTYPVGTLLQSNGSFYGITQPYSTGAQQQGTLYKMSTSGTVTTLYYFCSLTGCADGSYPQGLVHARDGNFYGTTGGGGTSATCIQTYPYGCGTIFRITPAGTLTTLHSFAGYPDDGNGPTGGLVQAADLNLYGTTVEGGANNYGTAFKITLGGILTTIYSFCAQEIHNQCLDGRTVYSGLVQGTDGNLYGVTYAGGRSDYGTI